MCDGGTDQKRACKPRTFGDGHGSQFFFLDIGAREYVVDQHQGAADMVAAGEFRHNAAVGAMHVDLSVHGVGKQTFFAINQRNARFVARAFNAENFHVKEKSKIEKCRHFNGNSNA